MLLRGCLSCFLDDHSGSPPLSHRFGEDLPLSLSQLLRYDTIWASHSQWRTRTSKQRLMLSKLILNGPSIPPRFPITRYAGPGFASQTL
jgi:hypothetical protein